MRSHKGSTWTGSTIAVVNGIAAALSIALAPASTATWMTILATIETGITLHSSSTADFFTSLPRGVLFIESEEWFHIARIDL